MIRSDFLTAGDPYADSLLPTAVQDEDKIIIDGGAAMGVWTEKVLKKNFRGMVYAFEPFPRNNELFRQRLGWPTNVVQFSCALYSRRSYVSFAVDKTVQAGDVAGYSSLGRIDAKGEVRTPEQRIDVMAVTLDDAVGAGHISLCKFDLQGGEQQALRGAARLLEEGRIDCLYIEFNGDKECLRLLRERGYLLYSTAIATQGDFDESVFNGSVLARSKTTTGLPLRFWSHNFGDMEDDDFVDMLRNFRRDHAYIQTDIVAVHPSQVARYVPKKGT